MGRRFYMVVEGGGDLTRDGEYVVTGHAGEHIGEIAMLRDANQKP